MNMWLPCDSHVTKTWPKHLEKISDNFQIVKREGGMSFFPHSLPVMFHCLCEIRYFPNIYNIQNN